MRVWVWEVVTRRLKSKEDIKAIGKVGCGRQFKVCSGLWKRAKKISNRRGKKGEGGEMVALVSSMMVGGNVTYLN